MSVVNRSCQYRQKWREKVWAGWNCFRHSMAGQPWESIARRRDWAAQVWPKHGTSEEVFLCQ